jgi:hypothetical protein
MIRKAARIAALALTGLLIGILSLAGCTTSDEAPEVGPPETIVDLERLTFRGVGIGDTEAEMKAVFGPSEPASLDESGAPLLYEDTPGPYGMNPWPGNIEPRWFRYDEVVFYLAEGTIAVIEVADPDARVSGGVKMGDDLAAAEAAYGLRCGTAAENTEYEPYPACAGRLGPRRHVWFGGDPIENITFGTVDLWGV